MSSQNDHKLDVKEDEKHLLIEHHYDNIQELNHPLPNWWNTVFIISTVFAVGYYLYYEFLGGPSLKEEFRKEYKDVLVAREAYKKAASIFDPDFYAQTLKENGVEKGKAVYELNCMPCHMENGRGDVGPNLSDNYWLLARGTPETIYNVAFHGSEENGMPAWGELIKKEEIYQAAAYVMTLHNTFAKDGKEPQGTQINE